VNVQIGNPPLAATAVITPVLKAYETGFNHKPDVVCTTVMKKRGRDPDRTWRSRAATSRPTLLAVFWEEGRDGPPSGFAPQ
jgi:hypothetical protein